MAALTLRDLRREAAARYMVMQSTVKSYEDRRQRQGLSEGFLRFLKEVSQVASRMKERFYRREGFCVWFSGSWIRCG